MKAINSSKDAVGGRGGAPPKSERCAGRCSVEICEIVGEFGVGVGVAAGGEFASIVQSGR